MKRFIQNIFSIKNSEDKSHKIITIYGLNHNQDSKNPK